MCSVGSRPHSQKVTHKGHGGSCSPEDTVRCPPFLSHPQAEPQFQHIISWGPHPETCSTPTFTSGELEGAPAWGGEEEPPTPQPGPRHGAMCGRVCVCVWMRVWMRVTCPDNRG